MKPEGLVDLHLHGAFGVDVLTAGPSDLDRMAEGLARRGTGAFLPPLVPAPLSRLPGIVARLSAWIASRRVGDGRGALPLGIHFEGPFVSPERCGALHREDLLDGRHGNLEAFFAVVGCPPGRHMVTLAPELPGGIDAVREFRRREFTVSIGHTSATVELLDAAFEAGARHMTHFANAMAPLHQRAVGPVGWGLLHDGVTVDVIGDLKHLSAEMLRLVWKAKGPGRVALISDAIPPAGCLLEGRAVWNVWGEELTVEGNEARNAKGGLAGSLALLDTGVANLAAIGIPQGEAVRAATEVPMRILGL